VIGNISIEHELK